jgi:hypothetical protein
MNFLGNIGAKITLNRYLHEFILLKSKKENNFFITLDFLLYVGEGGKVNVTISETLDDV